MLSKLLKYEIKATARTFLPVCCFTGVFGDSQGDFFFITFKGELHMAELGGS